MKKSAKANHQFYRPANVRPQDSVGYLMCILLHHVSQAIKAQLEPCGLTRA